MGVPLHGDLTYQLARAIQADRLREARQRAPRRPASPAGDDPAAHERTSARVLASLLLSRRNDPGTHRRWAEE
jgi:hypothetical protein